jgi:hypothetical protein
VRTRSPGGCQTAAWPSRSTSRSRTS